MWYSHKYYIMPNLASILVSNQAHNPLNTNVETYTSNAVKGDGYYGRSDGLHTVVWNLIGFRGTITIQGSLATDPSATDWVDIRLNSETTFTADTTGLVTVGSISQVTYSTSTTSAVAYNFTGNFVWVRAKITNWTTGSIESIRVNL